MRVKVNLESESESLSPETIKRQFEYSLRKSNVATARSLADEYLAKVIKLLGGSYIGVDDFVELICFADYMLFVLYGKTVVQLGSFSCFYMCRCARLGLLDGRGVGGCGECRYLLTCSDLEQQSTPTYESITAAFRR